MELHTRATHEPRPARPVRRCSEPTCITILCSANNGPKCFAHQDEPEDELSLRRAQRHPDAPDPIAA
jgi:hypothetical protein